ncbi:Myb/SANT-like domain [Dillenia turbinata]|uniref:Myb/SANT-like domain n=1 Tax=Dillenia turbinata TaxID=194707 RepID=A0AAN8WJI9_9MAGN
MVFVSPIDRVPQVLEIMDDQGPSTGDRPRTTWTIAMDRYFIEIMLERVHRGFKLRNSFTRNTWDDMVASMNKRFGHQLEKEVLQNRSKKLKQQYNIVKGLIQQNGFHWDDIRQMVVAEDDVWDDYIKDHPEAKPYRTKSMPSYDDFCVIYGEASAYQVVKAADYAPPTSPSTECLLRSSQVVDGNGRQLPSGSDRTRTNWTPTMDRYFIEIMIEQVLKGYKNNTIFQKKAWKAMASLFNNKFGLGIEKDVLKNRLKKLRLRYNAVKNLLEQQGFHWDDSRQMVVAEDHVWDDYIKVHPEARAYRTITVPSFKDLCVIFGNENGGGSTNSVTPSVHLDVATPEVKQQSENSQSPTVSAANDDMCLVRLCVIRSMILEALGVFLVILFPLLRKSSQLAEGMDNHDVPSADHFKISWTPPMDRFFIDVMLSQIDQGHYIGTSFKSEAWAHMHELFNAKFGLRLDKETLRSRFRRLRILYNAIRILLGHVGFHWDESRQMVVAEESVWDAYLKVHPEAWPYRTKTMPNYNDLCMIYGNLSSDGRHSFSVEFNDPSGGKIMSLEDPVLDIPESSSHSGGGVDTSYQRGKRPFAEPLNSQDSRKAQRSTDASMVDALRQMAFAVTSLANQKKESEGFISCELVVNALKAIPDIDEDLFLDACDLLEDEQKAKMFLALDAPIRKKWLLRKLCPQ